MAAQKLTITFCDESTMTVVPNLADTLNFERTLRKNPSWGTVQQNLLTGGPFRAWSALRRQGLTEMTWEEFSNGDTAVLSVDVEDDEDNDAGTSFLD